MLPAVGIYGYNLRVVSNACWKLFRTGALITLICSAFNTDAANVGLAWDANSDPNIAGYRLYTGFQSGIYSQSTNVGNTNYVLVTNLIAGKPYYFTVTAYNTTAVESAPSNQVTYTAPPSSPTPTATPSPSPKHSRGPAVMVSPVPASTLRSSTVTFQWTAGSATAYGLTLGSSPGAADIYYSTVLHTLSKTVTNIPTNGRTVYVTLYSQVSNNSWVSNRYTYTALK